MSDAHAAHGAHALPHIPTEGEFDFTNGKFAMWLFLISDAMAFIGFLGAYMVLRMASSGNSPVTDTLPWQPQWALPMDLILTGVNTFVLICSSVTMVKALQSILDGNVAGLKKFLALTMLGGSFFVGFQVYEWSHFIHEGFTMSGLVVPDLEKGHERAKHLNPEVAKIAVAKDLFGLRDLDGPLPEGKTKGDFEKGNFTEADYLALNLKLRGEGEGDIRPVQGGAIHHGTYSVPPTKSQSFVSHQEIFQEIEVDSDATTRAAAVKKYRDLRARVANGFSATFYVLTGFHGFHVFIGVCYLGIVLLGAMRGVYTPKKCSGVEIVGLYWHFVDLVWVLLFMVIYLIIV